MIFLGTFIIMPVSSAIAGIPEPALSKPAKLKQHSLSLKLQLIARRMYTQRARAHSAVARTGLAGTLLSAFFFCKQNQRMYMESTVQNVK